MEIKLLQSSFSCDVAGVFCMCLVGSHRGGHPLWVCPAWNILLVTSGASLRHVKEPEGLSGAVPCRRAGPALRSQSHSHQGRHWWSRSECPPSSRNHRWAPPSES